MIILPLNDPAKARELLNQEIANKYSITMLVFGDGDGEDMIANKADICASRLLEVRHVVWVRDPGLLTAKETTNYRKDNPDIVVCALNIDDQAVVYLNRTQANSYRELKEAFRLAEKN